MANIIKSSAFKYVKNLIIGVGAAIEGQLGLIGILWVFTFCHC